MVASLEMAGRPPAVFRDGWLGRAVASALAQGPVQRVVATIRPSTGGAYFRRDTPEIPPDGGEWEATRGEGGGEWMVRASGGELHVLSPARFNRFAAKVAEAEGELVRQYEENAGPGAQRLLVRVRSVGFRLHGDTPDLPAIYRAVGNSVERHYYRNGNPVGRDYGELIDSPSTGRAPGR